MVESILKEPNSRGLTPSLQGSTSSFLIKIGFMTMGKAHALFVSSAQTP